MTRSWWTTLLVLPWLAGCPDPGAGDDDTTATDDDAADDDSAATVDSDQDGTVDAEDCQPDDPAIHPGAREGCDDVDQDCDGETRDEGAISVAGVAFANLDNALGAAAPGDTVTVCAGTFAGRFDVDVALTLEGAGAGTTLLDGEGSGTVLTVQDAAVVVKGLTLTRGLGEDHGATRAGIGGGVRLEGEDASLVLEAVEVIDNEGIEGAGLHVTDGASLTLIDTLVADNSADERGGGLYIELAGTLSLTGSTFTGNTSDFGAALFAVADGEDAVVAADAATVFVDNEADTSGGALYVDSGDPLRIDGLRAEENIATYGAAIFSEGPLDLRQVALTGNEADNSGAALYLFSAEGTTTFTNSDVSDNRATYCAGILVSGGAGPALLDFDATTAVSGNTADYHGGGLCVTDSDEVDGDVTVRGLTLAGNTGAFGALMADLSGRLLLDSVEIVDNASTGLFVLNVGSVELVETLISGNTCAGDYASGIHLIPSGDGLSLAADSLSEVSGNTCTQGPGGLSIDGDGDDDGVSRRAVSVTGLRLMDNVGSGDGGGLRAQDTTLTLDGVLVEGNSAPRGAGLWAYGSVTLYDSAVLANVASEAGGGLFLAGGTLGVTAVDLGEGSADNTPDDLWVEITGAAYDGFGAGTTVTCDDLGACVF